MKHSQENYKPRMVCLATSMLVIQSPPDMYLHICVICDTASSVVQVPYLPITICARFHLPWLTLSTVANTLERCRSTIFKLLALWH